MSASVQVGTVLPELVQSISLVDMVAYAGATWDWHRLHYDREYIQERGLPGPVVDGQVFGALLAEQASSPFGPAARPVDMRFRFSAMLFAGVEVRVLGEVTAIDESGPTRRITVTQQLIGDDKMAIRDAVTTVAAPS